jgi:hypothetical protein
VGTGIDPTGKPLDINCWYRTTDGDALATYLYGDKLYYAASPVQLVTVNSETSFTDPNQGPTD